jgi:hypothetical protein
MKRSDFAANRYRRIGVGSIWQRKVDGLRVVIDYPVFVGKDRCVEFHLERLPDISRGMLKTVEKFFDGFVPVPGDEVA